MDIQPLKVRLKNEMESTRNGYVGVILSYKSKWDLILCIFMDSR